MRKYNVLQGDSREKLIELEDNSVDSVVTDPPYEIDFAGNSWDRSGVAFDDSLWKEVLRVLKPGGYLVAFSATRTYHRLVVAVEDSGFEIRDQLAWVYGCGFALAKKLEGNWYGWASRLKPAWEPICLARKPISGGLVGNVERYGTGALNVDACRVSASDGNRWPANVLHDGGIDVTHCFPIDRGGSVLRLFFSAKASSLDRDAGMDAFESKEMKVYDSIKGKSNAFRRNTHPTVKPTKLMRWLCRLVTPPGGLVLDPFTGSGSTGKACMLEGFRFLGIELSEEYVAFANARIGNALKYSGSVAEPCKNSDEQGELF